jgi:lipid II:glycine glycyltransferase (peptidoglycan interpeptide bridge formation enzyme)
MISENPLDIFENGKADIVEKRMCQFTKLDYADVDKGLMDSFHYKTRNMVRKSQKQDVEVFEDNEEIDFLYNTHFENMKAIGGTPKPELFFKNISKFLTPGVDYKIFIAQKDKVKISALLLFYFNGTVEYYTPVIKTEYRNLQPNSLLIFHAIMESAARGFKLWNWGGTWKSQEELYRFKSRWGAIDVDYNYYINIKNKDVLYLSKDLILSEYPFFFTVPFNLLNANG